MAEKIDIDHECRNDIKYIDEDWHPNNTYQCYICKKVYNLHLCSDMRFGVCRACFERER